MASAQVDPSTGLLRAQRGAGHGAAITSGVVDYAAQFTVEGAAAKAGAAGLLAAGSAHEERQDARAAAGGIGAGDQGAAATELGGGAALPDASGNKGLGKGRPKPLLWRKAETRTGPRLAMPSGRSGFAAFTLTPTDPRIFVHGGAANKRYFDELYAYNTEEASWSAVPLLDMPRARAYHQTVVIGPDPFRIKEEQMPRLFSYGGFHKGSIDGELLSVPDWTVIREGDAGSGRLVYKRPKRMAPSDSKNAGPAKLTGNALVDDDPEQGAVVQNDQWVAEAPQGDVPLPRCSHTLTVMGLNHVVMFGGWHGGFVNDFYVLDTRTWTWEYKVLDQSHEATYKPDASDVVLRARAGHTTNLLGRKRLIAYGGQNAGGQLGDVTLIDVAELTYRAVHPKGLEQPTPRSGHSATYAGGGELFVYGGFDGKRYLEDLWCLACGSRDPRDWTWVRMDVSGANLGPRCGHAAALLGDVLWVIGGWANGSFFSDVHYVDMGRATAQVDRVVKLVAAREAAEKKREEDARAATEDAFAAGAETAIWGGKAKTERRVVNAPPPPRRVPVHERVDGETSSSDDKQATTSELSVEVDKELLAAAVVLKNSAALAQAAVDKAGIDAGHALSRARAARQKQLDEDARSGRFASHGRTMLDVLHADPADLVDAGAQPPLPEDSESGSDDGGGFYDEALLAAIGAGEAGSGARSADAFGEIEPEHDVRSAADRPQAADRSAAMADALELIATTGGVLTAGLGGGGYGDDAGQRPPTFGDLGLDAIPAPEDLEGRRGGKGDGNGPAPTSPAGPRRYRRPQRQPRSPADASDSLAALSQLVLVSAPGAAADAAAAVAAQDARALFERRAEGSVGEALTGALPASVATAVTKLQARARAMIARRKAREARAATCVQAAARGWLARRKVADAKGFVASDSGGAGRRGASAAMTAEDLAAERATESAARGGKGKATQGKRAARDKAARAAARLAELEAAHGQAGGGGSDSD